MALSYSDMFGMFDASPAYNQQQQQEVNNVGFDAFTNPQPPQYREEPSPLAMPMPTMSWEDAFAGFKTHPVLYNMDGYISPYSSSNWGGTSNILTYLDDQSRLPALDNKVDPNKIFTAEINSLRALEADQQKIIKLFEKKLNESLGERGKVGLTEEDIEAMSALTAARNAVAGMTKERVNIKKNIADIRIKQNQPGSNSAPNPNAPLGTGSNSMDIGRSILDNIFDAPSSTMTPMTNIDYTPANVGDAGKVLDSLVPNVNANLEFESMEPTTFVMVGETDDDVSFATFNKEGDLLADFSNPDAAIVSVDRDAKKAVDQYMVEYPIKFK